MDYVIIILICLTAGGYGGYRIGVLYIKKENSLLQRQLSRLENFSQYWSSYSSGSNDLYNNVRHQQTMNLQNTMGTVIQLLNTIQHQPQGSISSTDQQRIQSIITQAQSIVPTSNLDDERSFSEE